MDGRLRGLDHAFNPRSIAFIGASENVRKWGFLILNNIITGGYGGALYPINPGRETILGLPVYASVLDVPGDVDLAIFTVPARMVLSALDDCIAKGAKAGLVITAGFKELGAEGAEMEKEMVRKARDAGMVLIGPNCQGICCPRNRLYPWMPILFHPAPGKVAFVAQSGNILNMLVERTVSAGLGVSMAVSSGNEADMETEDFYSYFGDDPETEVIVSYVEGVRNGRRFIEQARSVSRRKPIVVLKGGRTQSGVSAARSHTGSMAVSEKLFEAACRQAGIVTTSTIEEAGITAASFVGRPLPAGKRVGIITGGGGLGVIAADYCTEIGLDVVQLSSKTLDELEKLLPDWWVPGNPVDLVAGLDFTILKPVIEILMKSGDVDAVMFLWIGAPRDYNKAEVIVGEHSIDISKVWDIMDQHFQGFMAELYDLMWELRVPLYISTSIQPGEGEENGENQGGERPLNFPSVESACRAIRAMADHYSFRQL
ncbi:MAG: CoA-binding protein [Actinomycetota bacterium]|nr:CoA-binding protein [Actinomycetota bacterium]MDD5666562.1 CoA-binding protein [Actinomycetota bacterium]